MPYALGAQVQRPPDGFGRSGLAGMGREAKAMLGSIGVDAAEKFRRSLYFVTADANADDVTVLIAHRQFKHLLRFFYAEMAGGVENPEQRDAEIARAAGASTFEAFEDRREILLADKADPTATYTSACNTVSSFSAA